MGLPESLELIAAAPAQLSQVCSPKAPLTSLGAAPVLCNRRKRGTISMTAGGMAPVGSELVPGPVQGCEQALGRGSGKVELLKDPSLAAGSFEVGSAVPWSCTLSISTQ